MSDITSYSSPSRSNRAMALLDRLTPLQKIALGAVVLTFVAGAFVLTRAGSASAMAALYTDLEPRDAAAVTDELVSQGVDYELADGGRTVMVPADDVYDLRVALSAEGLPASNEGYALLDDQGITTSEFRQRVDYQRALEGELARTLRSIDGIESASVHLALPEDSVFVDEPEEVTASVLVRTDGRDSLTGEQVSAMVHLVASSVKGMQPENVTIADASGAVLSTAGEGIGQTTGDARSDATARVEESMSASIRSMVARVTGVDAVAVTVRADLDLTERQATTESFDSSDEEDGVVVSERVSTETYSGLDGESETGVLGPDGLPAAAEGGGSESTYQKDDTERSYAVNRTVESTTEAPGAVTRLNVAVLVDETIVTEAQRETIEEMVSTAAGVDLERGDQVEVTRLPFDTTAADAADAAAEELAASEAAAERSSMIRTAAIALVILLALVFGYLSTRRARREVATPIDIGAIRAATIDEPASLPAGTETMLLPTEQVDPIAVASREALDELSALADRRPEDVAVILQSWLADEESAAR